MGDLANTYVPGANMGNIFGDAWRKIKSDPLILNPPLWLAKEQIKAIPKVTAFVRGQVQDTLAPFRPAPQPSAIDQITAGLTSSSGSSTSSSSILPIALGAGALGLVLILALGGKKKKTT